VARPTKHQIEQLEKRMLEQREALQGSAREDIARWLAHPMGDIAGEVADAGDDSVAALVTDIDHAELARRVDAIREIDAAIERIRNGQYGTCVDCGGDIDYERLKAFPTAERDVACQSVHEKTYAHGETPTL
jgi:RNA polymerase-binding transcription factor DksA